MHVMGVSGRIAQAFIRSKLTPLLVVASLLLGVFATVVTPREEEPQIVVPMIDVMVSYPGASAREVESRVTTPMEKLLWEIKGVEYVYSIVRPGFNLTIVRFYVGENSEESLVKLYTKLMSNYDILPPGVSEPLVKPKSIDDVPILALTLWSPNPAYTGYELRRVGLELCTELKKGPDVSETTLIGGLRRQVRVTLDPGRLRAYQLSGLQIMQRLQQERARLLALLGAMHQGILFVDTDGHVSYCNAMFRELWAMPGGQAIVGLPMEQVLQACRGQLLAAARLDEQVCQSLAGEPAAAPLELELASGRILMLAIHRVHDTQNASMGHLWVCEDVTQQRQTAAQLITLAERDALTGLYNRRMFNHHLEQVMAQARREVAARLETLGIRPWLMPRGGFYLWCRLPEGIDSAELARLAVTQGVVLAPGNVFSVAQTAGNFMRFNVAQSRDPRVFEVLGQAMAAMRRQGGAATRD